MSFVIFNIDTTIVLENRRTRRASYATASAAEAGLTRILRARPELERNDFAIAEAGFFHENIELTRTVQNLMSGEEVKIPVNTPISCDPSSETYWSL